MKIDLFGTHKHDYLLELTCDLADIGVDDDAIDAFEGPVTVSVHVQRNGDVARLTSVVHAVVKLECARCLEEFTREVSGEFTIVARRLRKGEVVRKSEEAADIEDDEEDLVLLDYDTNEIDIAENVHDALLLEIPLKSICSENCKGLCPVCGQNLNEGECGCKRTGTDPRWNALSDLGEQ